MEAGSLAFAGPDGLIVAENVEALFTYMAGLSEVELNKFLDGFGQRYGECSFRADRWEGERTRTLRALSSPAPCVGGPRITL